MIKHLYIKNFVLIDEVNLDLNDGFSAFTGETGAGKSIFIDAISLLCAQRATASYVQKGKDKAIVEGTFTFDLSSNAYQVLKEAGFDDGEEVTFTREISSNGKTTARINHRIVTLSLMQEVLKNEIDIHGQRDNQYLLDTRCHLPLLDEYLGLNKQVEEVKESFNAYQKLVKTKEDTLKQTFNESDLDYFNFEIDEIEAANLKIGEDEELSQKEKQYKVVKDSLDKLNQIFNFFDDSFSDSFYEINHMIQNIKGQDNIESIQSLANDSYYNFIDAVDQLRALLDTYDLSEEEINEMEERLYTIQKLKRKYGNSIEEILVKKDELKEKVKMIAHRQEYLKQMDAQIDKAHEDYLKLAKSVSKVRNEKAHCLDDAIQVHLKELMLPNAKFFTEVKDSKENATGIDSVNFMIAMNKGDSFKPLEKSASGGELSRLMLGLKVIFTKLQGIHTIIFDEIDTGVSGPVASAIGAKMYSLGNSCQVFAVTHLAQVAASASNQYLVQKSDDELRTHTYVKHLSTKERVEQLALIANGEITDASLKAARELLKRNQTHE